MPKINNLFFFHCNRYLHCIEWEYFQDCIIISKKSEKYHNWTCYSLLQPVVVCNFEEIESTFWALLWDYKSNCWWLYDMVSVCLMRGSGLTFLYPCILVKNMSRKFCRFCKKTMVIWQNIFYFLQFHNGPRNIIQPREIIQAQYKQGKLLVFFFW